VFPVRRDSPRLDICPSSPPLVVWWFGSFVDDAWVAGERLTALRRRSSTRAGKAPERVIVAAPSKQARIRAHMASDRRSSFTSLGLPKHDLSAP